MTIPPEDLEVSDIRPPDRGGQHVGVPHSHIKVLHKPTGIYAVCSHERSQHRNRTVALRMVEYGLAEIGWKKPPTEAEIKVKALLEEAREKVRPIVEREREAEKITSDIMNIRFK